MGEERWRRSLRNPLGAFPILLAPFFFVWAAGSLPLPLRVVAAVLGVVSVAAAVDSFNAGIVVGSDGVKVKRTLVRRRVPWSALDGFAGERRGMTGRRIVIRAVPRNGRPFPISDHALDEDEATQLLGELGQELESRRASP